MLDLLHISNLYKYIYIYIINTDYYVEIYTFTYEIFNFYKALYYKFV